MAKIAAPQIRRRTTGDLVFEEEGAKLLRTV